MIQSELNLSYVYLVHPELINVDLTDASVYLFEGPVYDCIYNSKDDKLYINCKVYSLNYWLKNYVNIGRKYGYTEEVIEMYGNWFKSLKGDVK